MLSHPPLPYERSSSDVDRESRGVFRVLHDQGLALDCTITGPTLKPQSDVTDAEIQAAYLDLPQGFLVDMKDVLEPSVREQDGVGRDGVVEEAAAGRATGGLQESEDK